MAVQLQNNYFLPYTFNQKQAAEYIQLSVPTFRKYLATGKLPQPMRLGDRIIRFSRHALDEWLESRATIS
jgi:excisionase family DNA binding protein